MDNEGGIWGGLRWILRVVCERVNMDNEGGIWGVEEGGRGGY